MDFLGADVKGMLGETEPSVSPRQLLEVVTESMEKLLPGSLKGKARQNVLVFLVEQEYRHGIKTHITRAVQLRIAGRWNEHDPLDNSDRVDALIEGYKAVAGTTSEPGLDEKEIDQTVGPGGLTRLHLYAMDGEYDLVVEIVEKHGARLDVRDNLKQTPYDRARAFGHHRIAEYLKKKAASCKKG